MTLDRFESVTLDQMNNSISYGFEYKGLFSPTFIFSLLSLAQI